MVDAQEPLDRWSGFVAAGDKITQGSPCANLLYTVSGLSETMRKQLCKSRI